MSKQIIQEAIAIQAGTIVMEDLPHIRKRIRLEKKYEAAAALSARKKWNIESHIGIP